MTRVGRRNSLSLGGHNLFWRDFLRTAQAKIGLNARELAERAGIDDSYVSLMRGTGYVPTRDKVVDLARALGMDQDIVLLAAGYAPLTFPHETLQGLVIDNRPSRLCPDLARAVLSMDHLDMPWRLMAMTFFRTYLMNSRKRRRHA